MVSRIQILASLFGVLMAGPVTAASIPSIPILGDLLSGGAKVWVEKLMFEVNDKVNNNAPVAVHLLIYYDEATATLLQRMSSAEYFLKASQIKKDFGGSCDIFTFAATPGQRMPDQDIVMSKSGALGGFIFVRYRGAGAHREAIGRAKVIKVILGQDDFTTEVVVG